MKNLFLFLSLSALLCNGQQRLVTKLTESYSGNTWHNQLLQTNTYTNNITDEVTQVWRYSINGWRNYYQFHKIYNSNKTLSESTGQYWDTITSAYINSTRTTYTYNIGGKPTAMLVQTWYNSYFLDQARTTYTYDGSGYLINAQTETYNSTAQAWSNSSKTAYTNDSGGDPTLYLTEGWDVNTSSWVNLQRAIYSAYSSAGKPNFITYETWVSGGWQNNLKMHYTYSALASAMEIQVWNNTSSTWINSSGISYKYNSDNTISTHAATTWVSNSYQPSQRGTYTYEPDVVIIDGINELNTSATPAIYYDLQGNIITPRTGELIIESKGTVRRKIIIQQ